MKKQTQAPIIIDISGDYSIPGITKKNIGSVTGDLRLAELDAFLHCLNDTISDSPKDVQETVERRFTEFLTEIATVVKSNVADAKNIVLEVEQSVDTKTHTLSYTFSLKLTKDEETGD
jgi:hypothetical protein